MYRLTRCLFSPWTYLILSGVSMAVSVCAGTVAFLGYFAAWGRAGHAAVQMFDWGLIVAVVAFFATAGFFLTPLPLLVVRGIVVEFWPNTRPWLYFGPKPGAAATSPEEATSQQPLPAATPAPYPDAKPIQGDMPELRSRKNDAP